MLNSSRRTHSRLWLALSLGIVVVLAALPAGADTERLDFDRQEAQYRGPDDFKWGGIARDRSELRTLWERYNQRGPLPIIRFERNVAVLGGSGGSSSCRLRLHDLRLNRERERIIVRVYQNDGICTDDWVPRTFTVAIRRADLGPSRVRDIGVRTRRIDEPDS